MTYLYHYCTTSKFDSIISKKEIWLSSLSLSNDTMEGKLVAEIIDRLAKQDALDDTSIKSLQNAVTFLEQLFDGLGFCLSQNGDLLSQWRGYTDNATGFSIGFSMEYFQALLKHLDNDFLSLQRVEYEPMKQEAFVKPIYIEIKKIIDSGNLKAPEPRGMLSTQSDEDYKKEYDMAIKAYASMYVTMLKLFPKLYALKTEAFGEEEEWRLLSYILRTGNTEYSYRTLENCIVPYVSVDLTKLKTEPIGEVIIGPKNITPINVVEKYLKKHGFDNMTIRRSKATYR